MTGFRHGRSRRGALALVLVGVLLVGAGCGKPAYTYVTNQQAKTYFKVPSDWTPSTNTTTLDFYFAHAVFNAKNTASQAFDTFKKVRWVAEYEAPPDLRQQLDGPLVYGMVTPVTQGFQGGISLDGLRDILGDPVSQPARAGIISGGQQLPTGFELLDDEVLTPGTGMRGVRVVYNLFLQTDQFGSGYIATWDLTAMTNNDSSVLYALVVYCSTQCYRNNVVKINDVVTSFTVRSSQ
jgi:hypothetical protein